MPKTKKEEVSEVKPVETPEVEPNQFANPTGISLNQNNVKVNITDKDKENFYKAFLSDSTFQDEFWLFDKKVKVTFKSISVDENNDVFKQIRLDEKNGLANNSEGYLLTIMIYRLGLSLESIEGFEFEFPEIKEEEGNTYVAQRSEIFKKWGNFKLSAFLKVFMEFESKLFQLEQAVLDPNFWKAAE